MIKKPKIVDKNWGREIHWTNNTDYCGKTLVLKSGCHCSLHSHWKREHFMIQSGNVKLALEKRLLQDKDIGEMVFFDLYRVERSALILSLREPLTSLSTK